MITMRMKKMFGISIKIWELSLQSPFSWNFLQSQLHPSPRWKYMLWFTTVAYLTAYVSVASIRTISKVWVGSINRKAFATDILFISLILMFVSLIFVTIQNRIVQIQAYNGLLQLDNQLQSNFCK